MTGPLLSTKNYIPAPRPNFVPRARLVQRLDDGLALGHRLILISAPAGFGKTTLISEWLRDETSPAFMDAAPPLVAWVSLDSGDNDPIRFWSYVLAALQTLWADLGQAAQAALQAPQAPPPESMLAGLINELAAILDQNLVLVLDDYHVIQTSAIHESVAFLIQHQPPLMHLVIATRADPPLPLARLRGRGQVTELRVSDLRFTNDEAAAFLNQVAGLQLAESDVSALEKRTEGWITGLQLAALSMKDREDISGFIQAFTGSNRYVLDYLTEEVLQRQPPDTQSFLLETAILERLTGPLCDAVTGRQDGKAMLSTLDQANLFLTTLDDERRWYRYHRLFADLLRARLVEALSHRVADLHQRASAWFEQEGLLDDAVSHAIAGGDPGRVAAIIETHGMQLLMQGELTTLLRWIQDLPEEKIQASARICVSHAWALLLTGRAQMVEPRLQQAERLFAVGASSEPIGEPALMLTGEVATIRAYQAAQDGDARRTIELAHLALERLPPTSLGIRGIVYFVMAGAHLLQGEMAMAAEAMREAAETGLHGGNIHVVSPALNALAGLEMLQGRLHQAQTTAQEAIHLASGPGGRALPIAAGAISALAEVAYEWNDLEGALAYAQQSVELSRQWGNSDTLCSGLLTLAQVQLALGKLEAASAALGEAEASSADRAMTPLFAMQLGTGWVRLWMAQGNMDAARHWAQDGALVPLNPIYPRETLALAHVHLALGQPGAAQDTLDKVLQTSLNQNLTAVVVETLALQSLAYQAQGASEQALAALDKALSLAEGERFVRTFVDQGEPLASLLVELSQKSPATTPAYVAQLLEAFDEEHARRGGLEAPTSTPSGQTPSPLVELLSERELEILQLVAEGLSNQEIADACFIAVSTVKSHLNHAFGKLNAKSRTQAVAQAKELGLL
jgi:LuxR family maltose regulon positive regulatory protein